MPEPIRCAIYTRKSSEEGLEQSFNSLDAQREACAAFILSQRHEGWELLPQIYDDGGYSGGNTDRPALVRLFSDIREGLVDNIIVYKIDRLTRSLADFSKMVELFDQHKVSFVAVTQQFNTTTSMGRLTLNVLLSFAQFEREVTGERIRDKIAASKAKGMWMGGTVPLGYESVNGKLIVSPTEASLVRHIFARYVVLKSVLRVQRELTAAGHRTRQRGLRPGRMFMQGNLANILSNQIYIGNVRHKCRIYPGLHDSLIEPRLWATVQALRRTAKITTLPLSGRPGPGLLMGKIFDDAGRPMSPASHGTQKRKYRYYISQGLIQDTDQHKRAGLRVPAHGVEELVFQQIARWLDDPIWLRARLTPLDEQGFRLRLLHSQRYLETLNTMAFTRKARLLDALLIKVSVKPESLEVHLAKNSLQHLLDGQIVVPAQPDSEAIVEALDVRVQRNGKQMVFVGKDALISVKANPALVRALVLGHRWRRELITGQFKTIKSLAIAKGIGEAIADKYLRLALLSPAITKAILNGTQPRALTLGHLTQTREPDWKRQMESYKKFE